MSVLPAPQMFVIYIQNVAFQFIDLPTAICVKCKTKHKQISKEKQNRKHVQNNAWWVQSKIVLINVAFQQQQQL